MSTVFIDTVMLPSALTLTMATEAVGEIDGLDADGDAATAAKGAGAAVERCVPVSCVGDGVEHLLDRGIMHLGAGRLGPPLADDVLAPELDRIEAKGARDHVGVAFVGPDQLRNPEAAHAPQQAAGWCKARRNRW